ncbi:MAG: magnesium transporter MgtE [Phycisphaerae bacterium]|nr:MAG: magnesium transporter [Planctomycetia bacterium]RIK70979.1 MAG: magnesium transporter [Planctomycetota bacterium]GJQ25058.1 MAG: magnesium transporter MgtE [Phycisphaerae bacterium]
MLGELLRPEIEEMLAARHFAGLREALADLPPADIADLFADLPPEQVAVLFRILPRAQATDVFEYLPVDVQESTLRAMGQEDVAAVLNEMDPDDRTALLEEMPGEAAQRLINLLSPEERRIASKLLGYPEESIGRRMTPDYVAVRADWTISHVFSHLRQVGKDKETLNVVFVTDERGRLIDDIALRQLVLADPNDLVKDIMDGHFPFLRAYDDQEEAVRTFKKYDRSVLPVVDSSNILVGIVTVDDVLDVAEQEETEDVQKMAAVQALDEPYLATPFTVMVRKRAGWLLALFAGELLTATAMGYFEHEIARAVVLALFVPLIISSGGNAGSQGASLIIRAMALGEVTLGDWWRIMRREVMSGLALGSILGIVAFVRIALWPWRVSMYGEHYLIVAFAVGTSLVGVVMWGTLSGSMLPLIMRRLGFDPAVSSAPFVATLVDVTGLVIYFLTAKVILTGTLL